jgi:hypothetical protein
MTELFPDISEKVRSNAEIAWRLAQTFHNPISTVKFLSDYTAAAPTDEEREFLQFYFNLQMELLKNE